jgi:hypothetical protein
MNPQNERSKLPPRELPPSLLPVGPAVTQESTASTMEDRLYQLAALTAGAFLLASLL